MKKLRHYHPMYTVKSASSVPNMFIVLTSSYGARLQGKLTIHGKYVPLYFVGGAVVQRVRHLGLRSVGRTVAGSNPARGNAA